MRIKMPAVRIAQDSDTSADTPEGSLQDILTCGSCQKTFALSDIVRFIQHKVNQCNKENYGQCFSQGGTPGDRDADDGRPLSLVNTRRPSISAPISARKPSGSRVHSPPLSSPAELLLGDGGSSSTPKRLSDDNDPSTPVRRAISSPLGSSSMDEVNKADDVEIKQERMDTSSSHGEESPLVDSKHPAKKLRTQVADAESNTMNTEPSNYVCSTCKTRLHSAWRLVQHVQHSHGVKIYVESSPSSLLMSSSPASTSSLNPMSLLGVGTTKGMKDLSGSSTCSSASSSSSLTQPSQSVSVPPPTATTQVGSSLPPPGLRHHPLLPPPDMHGNPFGLLRMPLPPLSQGPVVPPVAPLFSRPHDHHFRMEQLVSEQFRHHGINLAAAAVAAANSLATPHSAATFPSPSATPVDTRPPSSRPSTTPSVGAHEPQMDFYSQRLRQLAGTTSPGAGGAANSSSPSPRKQSPPFASPSPSQLPPTPLTNNSRPHSLTPPETKVSGDSGDITTPRSASTPPTHPPEGHGCDFCGKKFRFQSNLIVHRRIHTGDKALKCTSCDFTCLQAGKLKRHMKVHRTPDDQKSNAGSVETLDGEDESNDELDEEDEMLKEDDDEEDLDDEFEDEAEDLSVPNSKLVLDTHKLMSQGSASSLVGELMDKFGLSNIAQYSEAYKQALQESGNALKLHLTSKDRDNNNSAGAIPGLQDKLNGLPVAALRLREEFTKNMLQQQSQQQSQVPLFNPFENPFEASKRIKLEGAPGPDGAWWGLPGLHRGNSLFEDLKSKGVGPAGGLLQNPLMKKEQKRNDTCEYCGKVFKNCSNLTVHRRSHTGEKPYKCELCSYACAQSSKLTRHMKTHGRMGKDVYRCRFCDMPFSVPSTLEKHMRKCVVNQGKQQAASLAAQPGGHLGPLPAMPMIAADDEGSMSMPKTEAA
uniref:Putative c2h2-type zn-finger protein n=1 Tax=Phlebotomus kandelakii TaxID=1109342 RepID=A0A6B2E5B8_9DIPT